MKKIIVSIILTSWTFCTGSWINMNGFDVSANQLVIRFNDQHSDYLRMQQPISDVSIDSVLSYVQNKSMMESFSIDGTYTTEQILNNLNRYFTLSFDPQSDLQSIINDLLLLPTIETVEFVYKMEMSITPNDSLYTDQWEHNNQGQAVSYGGQLVGESDCDSDSDEAWDISTGSSDVIIAILDTGVNHNHEEFTGRILQGNDFVNDDSDPTDDNGHGTSCAGIAAARGNNNTGIAGVCWDCGIMPVKVLNSSGNGDSITIADAVRWASDNGAKIISMSLGGGSFSSYFEDAINYAVGNGTVVFAASGNNNSSISYPALYQNCIAVGALSPCNERKRSSSDPSECNLGVSPDSLGVTCDGEYWWGSNYGSDRGCTVFCVNSILQVLFNSFFKDDRKVVHCRFPVPDCHSPFLTGIS